MTPVMAVMTYVINDYETYQCRQPPCQQSYRWRPCWWYLPLSLVPFPARQCLKAHLVASSQHIPCCRNLMLLCTLIVSEKKVYMCIPLYMFFSVHTHSPHHILSSHLRTQNGIQGRPVNLHRAAPVNLTPLILPTHEFLRFFLESANHTGT